MVAKEDFLSLMGLPWQLIQKQLQAACIPYEVTIGANYNRRFTLSDEALYVARITEKEDGIKPRLQILLYYPMVNSGFNNVKEADYVQWHVKKEERTNK